MDVKVWAGTNKRTLGIRVGVRNRRQYFNSSWTHIRVELDGKINIFSLTNGFWRKCPEIRDHGKPVIQDWLRWHNLLNWRKGYPPALTLLPLGGNSFRLLVKLADS